MKKLVVLLAGLVCSATCNALSAKAESPALNSAVAAITVGPQGISAATLFRQAGPGSAWGSSLSDATTPALARHFAGNFLGLNADVLAAVFVDNTQDLRARITQNIGGSAAVLWPHPLNESGVTIPLALVAGDFSSPPDGITDLAVVYRAATVKIKVTFGPDGVNSTTWAGANLGSSGIITALAGKFSAASQSDQIALVRLAEGSQLTSVQLVGAPLGASLGESFSIGSALNHKLLAGDFDGNGLAEFAKINYQASTSKYRVQRYSGAGAPLSSVDLPVSGLARFLVSNFAAEVSGSPRRDELMVIESASNGNPAASVFSLAGATAGSPLYPLSLGAQALNWLVAGNFDVPTYSISGKVTLPGALTPLPNATILNTSTGLSVTTDSQGAYRMLGLGAGTYHLKASFGSYAFEPATRDVTIFGGDQTNQDFIAIADAPNRFSISGNVQRATGIAAANFPVALRRAGAAIPIATALTNSGGDYFFAAVPMGAYDVLPVVPSGHEAVPAQQTINTLINNTTLPMFLIRPIDSEQSPKSISGHVLLPGGVGLPGVTIKVTLGTDLIAQVVTDAAGSYQAGPIASASYSVTPELSGFTFAPVNRSASVGDASVANIDFDAISASAFRITGKVVRPGGLEPISGVAIRTVPATAEAITGSDGAFTLSGIRRGTYAVRAELNGVSIDPAEVITPVNNADVSGVTFYVLSPQRFHVRGLVTRVDGSAVPNVAVTFMQGTTPRSVLTNIVGAYDASDLPLGSYVFTPRLSGVTFSPTSRSIPIGSSDVSDQDFQAICPAGEYLVGTNCVAAAALEPRLECVSDNLDGTLSAYFGFHNHNQAEVVVPRDTTIQGFKNALSPAATQPQLETFTPGRSQGSVRVVFPANAQATWQLQFAGITTTPATATAQSPRCAAVQPEAQCLSVSLDREILAHFSYQNDNPFALTIPRGALNSFNPAPDFRGQPERFEQGHILNVLALPLGSGLTWKLNGLEAQATSNTQLCQPNSPPVSVVGGPYTQSCQGILTQLELDGSQSSDVDGTRLAYQWSTDCPNAELSSPNGAETRLVLHNPGQGLADNCHVTLKVFDGLVWVESVAPVSVSACNLDCRGVPNGNSRLDLCGVCDGNNACLDCAGVPFGQKTVDQCGVCGGNNACLDCSGVPNGTARIDSCGVCKGNGLSCLDCVDVPSRRFSERLDRSKDALYKNASKVTRRLMTAMKDLGAPTRRIKKLRAKLKLIDSIHDQMRTSIFAIPERIFTCPETAQCSRDDYLVLISSFSDQMEQLYTNGKQSGKTLAKLGSGKYSDIAKKHLANLKKLLNEGKTAVNSLPRFVSSCGQLETP